MVLDFGYGFGHGQVFILGGVFFQSPSRLFFLGWWNHLLVLASAPRQWDQLVWCMDMHRCLLLISFQFSWFFPSSVHVLRVFGSGEDLPPCLVAFFVLRSYLFLYEAGSIMCWFCRYSLRGCRSGLSPFFSRCVFL